MGLIMLVLVRALLVNVLLDVIVIAVREESRYQDQHDQAHEVGASDAEEGGRGWAHAARQVLARGEVRDVNFHFMGLIMLVLVSALLADSYYNHVEEDVDEEGANAFDYGELPEDDADNERVFVG